VSALRKLRRDAAAFAKRLTSDERDVLAAGRSSVPVRRLVQRVGLVTAAKILRAESDRRRHVAAERAR
jgi:hypothetical protein